MQSVHATSVSYNSGQLYTTSFCSLTTNITVRSPETNFMLNDNGVCEQNIQGCCSNSHV